MNLVYKATKVALSHQRAALINFIKDKSWYWSNGGITIYHLN